VLDATAQQLVVAKAAASGVAGHGFFTGAMLAALAAPATDDGAVQLSELVDAVTDRVVRATHGLQSP
jgi:hypothetical protein